MKNNKEINDLKEWQSKQYSPGNFIGTGKVPRPIMGLTKYPTILICIGISFLVFSLLCLLAKIWIFSLVNFIFFIIFLYGGIARIINKK